jgi:hypothetical protein
VREREREREREGGRELLAQTFIFAAKKKLGKEKKRKCAHCV